MAQMVKICLPSQRPGFSPWVGNDPLEKGMATYSSILARRIPWTEEPGGLQSMEPQRVNMTERLTPLFFFMKVGSL